MSGVCVFCLGKWFKSIQAKEGGSSKGSKLMGKQVGVGWFKMIQASEEDQLKRIQANN